MPARATSRPRWPRLPSTTPAAASSWSSAAGAGISRPRPTSPISCAATREEPRRLSRAATETLAIIAYHEPVSRAEIEAIRGVQISKGTLDVLMEAGWVRTAGRREGPGPAAALRDDAGLPHPFRARLAPRPAGDRRPQGRRPARPARRGGRFSFNWKVTTRRTKIGARSLLSEFHHGRFQPLA